MFILYILAEPDRKPTSKHENAPRLTPTVWYPSSSHGLVVTLKWSHPEH